MSSKTYLACLSEHLASSAALFSAISEGLLGSFEPGDGSPADKAFQRATQGLQQVKALMSCPQPTVPDLLESCVAMGMKFKDCIGAIAVSNDDPHVKAAREAVRCDDDVEIDDVTITAAGDGGSWVLSWMWISNDQAGV